MKHEELVYLHDIKIFCERIIQYTTNLNESEWLGAIQTQDSVERNFEKIAEALKLLQRFNPDLARRIPRVPKIIGFRNVLIHQYRSLDQTSV